MKKKLKYLAWTCFADTLSIMCTCIECLVDLSSKFFFTVFTVKWRNMCYCSKAVYFGEVNLKKSLKCYVSRLALHNSLFIVFTVKCKNVCYSLNHFWNNFFFKIVLVFHMNSLYKINVVCVQTWLFKYFIH